MLMVARRKSSRTWGSGDDVGDLHTTILGGGCAGAEDEEAVPGGTWPLAAASWLAGWPRAGEPWAGEPRAGWPRAGEPRAVGAAGARGRTRLRIEPTRRRHSWGRKATLADGADEDRGGLESPTRASGRAGRAILESDEATGFTDNLRGKLNTLATDPPTTLCGMV